jgi:hypothetical protein
MRAYSVNQVRVSLTAAITEAITITAHTNRSLIITRAWVSQSGNATSAQQAIALLRQSASGTSVTAPNVNPLDPDDTAAGFTVKGMCTTLGTDGAVLYTDSFNWQNGWLYLPVPEERPVVVGAGIVCLKFPVAPVAQTLNCGIDIIEVG